MNKKILNYCKIAIGLIAIILSIVCFTMDVGYGESDKSYGGDAYTGIQNAAAQTARNVKAETEIVRFGFGSLLLVSGLYIVCIGTENIIGERKETKHENVEGTTLSE